MEIMILFVWLEVNNKRPRSGQGIKKAKLGLKLGERSGAIKSPHAGEKQNMQGSKSVVCIL